MHNTRSEMDNGLGQLMVGSTHWLGQSMSWVGSNWVWRYYFFVGLVGFVCHKVTTQ